MLREELIEGGNRVRHYSDEDYMILQIETGIMYEDAVDVIPCPYTYEETDVPIEHDPPPEIDPDDFAGTWEAGVDE